MKIFKRILMIGLAVFTGIQFIPVPGENPETPPELEVQASEEVMRVLVKACYDCHSNKVRWPVYSRIAPVSWLIAHDVNHGREMLNFSEWGKLSERKKRRKAEDSFEEIENENMPMQIYLFTHPEAVLTEAEVALIEEWSETF